MKIGIIGAGSIGGTLAKHFSRVGHEVSVANSRGPESLKDFAEENNVKAVTVQEAARENDLVVISIPQGRVPELPKDLFEGVSENVIILDTGNYYPILRNEYNEELEGNLTHSEWVSQFIGRPVIKVFNSIGAASLLELGRPENDSQRIALAVSGDNPAHKQVVRDLLNETGFNYFDNGDLKDSWRHEPGTPAYCTDFTLPRLKESLEGLGTEKTPEVMDQIKTQRTQQEKSLLGRL